MSARATLLQCNGLLPRCLTQHADVIVVLKTFLQVSTDESPMSEAGVGLRCMHTVPRRLTNSSGIHSEYIGSSQGPNERLHPEHICLACLLACLPACLSRINHMESLFMGMKLQLLVFGIPSLPIAELLLYKLTSASVLYELFERSD